MSFYSTGVGNPNESKRNPKPLNEEQTKFLLGIEERSELLQLMADGKGVQPSSLTAVEWNTDGSYSFDPDQVEKLLRDNGHNLEVPRDYGDGRGAVYKEDPGAPFGPNEGYFLDREIEEVAEAESGDVYYGTEESYG